MDVLQFALRGFHGFAQQHDAFQCLVEAFFPLFQPVMQQDIRIGTFGRSVEFR
ncbi:hypothetical protein D3C87_2107430 [compost metagenome]